MTKKMRYVLHVVAAAGAIMCVVAVVCIAWFSHGVGHLRTDNVSDSHAMSNSRNSTHGYNAQCSSQAVASDAGRAVLAIREHVNYSQEAILSRPLNSIVPDSLLPENATILTNDSLPERQAYIPEVGNGHIATVVQSDTILMNGLYNGRDKTSHRARIPSTSGYLVNWTSPSGLERKYSLDIGRGIFTESYTGAGVTISLRTYAHRSLPLVMVNELTLSRENTSIDVSVKIVLNRGQESEDVNFYKDSHGILHGETKEAEYPEIAPTIRFYMLTSASLEGVETISSGLTTETFVSLTSIDVNKTKAIFQYEQARAQFLDGTLLSSHVDGWNQMWQRGRIDIAGDITISKMNYACLYYLMSSLPLTPNRKEWPFFGLSPGGLAHGVENLDYMGHVFWDQDTWMFPPIAFLHSDIGRTLVQTRIKTLRSAQLLAKRSGNEGAKYPWESSYTGLETCPAEPYGRLEIHVIGDVAMMMRQYWQLTRDVELMVDLSGADVVWETAKYWAARSTYNETDDTFSINGVMPPDEFNFPVNDSVYTNSIAALNLRFANQLARFLGKSENETWSNISSKLLILYDETLDFHPEFQGFSTYRHRPKQADVVLLGYPLMVDMKLSTRKNDLMIYEEITSTGPAMTWGMFLLGWLELDNVTKANELYQKTVANAQEPFLVWAEYADGDGATNFLTGMGGYLQMILFGYGGCRIRDETLTFKPVLMEGSNEMTFIGIDYRGCSFDLRYSDTEMTLNQTHVTCGSIGLSVRFNDSGAWHSLTTGIPMTRERQSFEIKSLP
ncbi:acid trehalase-like protein 1 isoform X1 [Biomphalaria pfeifferi]|uniref:Protein-glucosylgalactosylhydroxylysine glucosidase n=1 Tax=Biomphalaria pfeifferi TaxID=112525 RepID=A0AAD8ATT0_BIOPF|nr:acid trehalase-like protein 1 isoform X1 [Biomphalaria pfeifferi]